MAQTPGPEVAQSQSFLWGLQPLPADPMADHEPEKGGKENRDPFGYSSVRSFTIKAVVAATVLPQVL